MAKAKTRRAKPKRMLQVDFQADVTEEDVKDATSVIQRDYYDDVENVGDELIDRIKDGEIPSRDDFHDALHDAVDGTQRVTYTWQARLGLLATSNSDAYFEEFGDELVCDGGIPYEKLMFAAMERDVLEYMTREGVDPDDESIYDAADEED